MSKLLKRPNNLILILSLIFFLLRPPLVQYFQVCAPTVRSSRPITNLHLQPSEFTTRVIADRFMRQELTGETIARANTTKTKGTIQVATGTGELNQANDETKSMKYHERAIV